MVSISDLSNILNILDILLHFKYYNYVDKIFKDTNPNTYNLSCCVTLLRGTWQHIDNLKEWKPLAQRIKKFCIESKDKTHDYEDILMGLLDKID